MAHAISYNKVFKVLIGLVIGLFGRYLPPFSISVPATEELIAKGFPLINAGQDVLVSLSYDGMIVASIFLATIFLWTTLSITWTTFLAVLLVGTSGFLPAAQVMNTFMGNPVIVMFFFLFIFVGIVAENNLAAHLVQYLLTRKIIQGRPWLLVTAILVATFLVGQISQTLALLLIWSALYNIFDTVGYKRGDTFASVMIVYVAVVALLVLCQNPITGGALPFIFKVQELGVENPSLGIGYINLINYFIFGLIITACCIAAYIFVMRYIYKLDVSLLKNFDLSIFEENKLPPLNRRQKAVIALFILMLIMFFLPSAIGTDSVVGAFLNKTSLLTTLFITFLATVIHIDGKPITKLSESLKHFPWDVYFLLCGAFMFASFLGDPRTNITTFIQYAFASSFSNIGYVGFAIIIIVVGSICSNFIHSGALGLATLPAIVVIAQAFDFPQQPIIVLYSFALLFAMMTAAASPYGALLYANTEWIRTKDIIKHGGIATLIFLAILIVIGIPLANFLF